MLEGLKDTPWVEGQSALCTHPPYGPGRASSPSSLPLRANPWTGRLRACGRVGAWEGKDQERRSPGASILFVNTRIEILQ